MIYSLFLHLLKSLIEAGSFKSYPHMKRYVERKFNKFSARSVGSGGEKAPPIFLEIRRKVVFSTPNINSFC